MEEYKDKKKERKTASPWNGLSRSDAPRDVWWDRDNLLSCFQRGKL